MQWAIQIFKIIGLLVAGRRTSIPKFFKISGQNVNKTSISIFKIYL